MKFIFQIQSLEERREFLLFARFFILTGMIFFATSILIFRFFPALGFSMDIFGYKVFPAAGLFQSLTFMAVILAIIILGTVYIKWFFYLQMPLLVLCMGVTVISFASIISAFFKLGFIHGVQLFGVFAVESAILILIAKKFIDWLDSRYGNKNESLVNDFLGNNK